jgi:hypothetical protein
MFETWPDLILGALAGPLVVAGAAKLSAAVDSLSWPFDRGVLAVPYGPRVVGVVELATAGALVVVPGGPAAWLGIGAYLSLTGAAAALRGRRCACFGRARLAAVNRTHVAGNLVSVAAAAVALAGGPGSAPVLRVAAAAVTAATTVTALLISERRRAAGPADPDGCTERVSAVMLYTMEGCPSCRSLRTLLDAMEPARRDQVTTTVLRAGETLPPLLTGLGVPAAYAVGSTGEPVCATASGIGAVKALIDTITVRPAKRAGVGDER